jgi:hypothetical protein
VPRGVGGHFRGGTTGLARGGSIIKLTLFVCYDDLKPSEM